MVQRINPDDIEVFTLKTHPPRTFYSSSLGVVSGSVNVFARRSFYEKEVFPLSIFTGSYSDENIDVIRQAIVESSASNKSGMLRTYIDRKSVV